MPHIISSLFLVTLAMVSLSCASQSAQQDGVRTTESQSTHPLPEFSIQDMQGNLFRSEALRGKVALVNFWATWCGPCKIEMPWFVEFQRKYKDRGFTVLAISLDEGGWDPVRRFATEMELNFPVVLGDDPLSLEFGGIRALPTTMIVNREGNVVATHTGLVPKQTYETAIEELL